MSVSMEDLENRWRSIDVQLARGELDSNDAIEALGEAGLVRRARAFGITAGTMWVAQPAPGALVPGPRLVVDFGELYGGPRIYRPVRDLLLPDTSISSDRVPG